MTADGPLQVLVASAHAIEHDDDLESTLYDHARRGRADLQRRIRGDGRRARGRRGPRDVASFGLDERAAAGLSGAIARPTHPIARTFAGPALTYDVAPVNPGGTEAAQSPAAHRYRSESTKVVGVLALAHEDSIDAVDRPVLEAVADLAAVAIERHVG